MKKTAKKFDGKRRVYFNKVKQLCKKVGIDPYWVEDTHYYGTFNHSHLPVISVMFCDKNKRYSTFHMWNNGKVW